MAADLSCLQIWKLGYEQGVWALWQGKIMLKFIEHSAVVVSHSVTELASQMPVFLAQASSQSAAPATPPVDTPLDQATAPVSAMGETPVTALQNSAEVMEVAASNNIMTTVMGKLQLWGGQALDWLQSPPFLAQVAAVVGMVFLARILTKMLTKRVAFLNTEPVEGKWLRVTSIVYQLRNLVFPALLIALYAAVGPILRGVDMFGQDWLVRIAQGLAVVFFLYKVIKQFIAHPLVQKLVIWIAIPVAVLKVFGWFDGFMAFMDGAAIELGTIKISAAMLARIAIFGSLLAWVGRISNDKGKKAIRSQNSIDIGTREVFAKMFEIVVFGILFMLLMNIAGIPMSSLVVLGSALMLGIGFGLQPIAANFVSGLILLLDRSLKIGDYVVLPDGQEGHVEALNMRSCTVETTDGKDIMVPNVKFIEEVFENWTHKDPRQRYEVHFSVSYDTDIDALEGILIPAVSAHHQVLQEPEKPDLELREFGDHGIMFAIEFWADGIDDGANKFTSDLNFIVWRTLRQHNVQMPFPRRDVRILKD